MHVCICAFLLFSGVVEVSLPLCVEGVMSKGKPLRCGHVLKEEKITTVLLH